jgi:hypothetical protein
LIAKRFEISSQNVVKLAGLIDGMAAALQVAPSRVRTAAAHLRKHKLLTTGPRGPGAPDMTPSDAVNLLLATMYDDELAVAERSARNLNTAPFVRCTHLPFGESDSRVDDFPRNGFFGDREAPLLFGEVLATILDWFVRYGSLEEGGDYDLDLGVVNLTVTVSHPGYAATIRFNTHEGFWNVDYEWKSPDQIEFEAQNKGKLLVPVWGARKGPHIWSSRTVGEDSIFQIADCLRGSEWNESWEAFTPSYDKTHPLHVEVEPA